MKVITFYMVLASVLLFGKFIGRIKKVVYDIALISNVNNKKFKDMSLFDVSRFVV